MLRVRFAVGVPNLAEDARWQFPSRIPCCEGWGRQDQDDVHRTLIVSVSTSSPLATSREYGRRNCSRKPLEANCPGHRARTMAHDSAPLSNVRCNGVSRRRLGVRATTVMQPRCATAQPERGVPIEAADRAAETAETGLV